ncbi:MAG TPA: glycogen debranching protein GlgX [Terriglobales bacterium]
MGRIVLPGRGYPLGASWDGTGVNFALYSERAERVELCLFDSRNGEETERIEVKEQSNFTWHCYVRGLQPGQLYGYRVYGPYRPEEGLRFNPNKLLIDPYALAVAGKVNWEHHVFGYPFGGEDPDLKMDESDSAPGMPKSVVVNPFFDWEHDRLPRTALSDSIIYEVHVKGFSKLNPEVPEELRGTYAALAHPASLRYFKKLGITAVELLPVHDFLDDKHLLDRGLSNYWGYNTTNFFSPDARYSSSGDRGGQVTEFKAMVKALHRAGIEVILDVVYNHTSEGNHLGPTLSFRGVDNTTYYRLTQDNPRFYMDYTGTGNSLNARHPQVLKLIMDSLRYWVQEMHVDGFRFDLAATLARELHDVDRLSAFFDIIHQDPVISMVKLIAEPWDVGEGGYQVGNFPVLWAEWNGKYRDTVRRYWKGDEGQLSDVAYRLTGSSDLYQWDGRRPTASINFITAHDGFTLEDLVSYNEKHNEANGENNNDGANDNNSWNMGVEGPTNDPEIIKLRERQKRNFLATLLFSQGVPMICGGDEVCRTQNGNNNAYCQDNEISWMHWECDERQQELFDFVCKLIRIRLKHPNLHRRKFNQDRVIRGSVQHDMLWLRPDGQEMTDEEWNAAWVKSMGLLLNGKTLNQVSAAGEQIKDDTFLLLLNSSHEPIEFTLPGENVAGGWEVMVDTNVPAPKEKNKKQAQPGEKVNLEQRSMLLLRERPKA